jgi:predicted metal-dependent phosphoesterase TrpH
MWSGDCTTTPDEIAEAVGAAAIDVLCITDHHAVKGAAALGERLDCQVVVGEEVRTHRGEMIGLFLTDRIPQGLPARETAQRIRDQGGLVYVPHPFDELRHNLDTATLVELAEDGLVDALEVFNAKTSLQSLNRRASALAAELGLAGGAGSDAHVPDALGAAYVEMPPFTDAASFLAALRQGRVVGHHSDPARRWRPRIVPSTS